MRITHAALLAGAMLVFGTSAHASSDYSCESNIRPTAAAFSDCNSTALIAPGNDTRVNLALLMIDRHGTALQADLPKQDSAKQPVQSVPFGWTDFRVRAVTLPAKADEAITYRVATGEGSICLSNDAGQSGFIAALDADRKLPADERMRLADARKRLRCGTSEAGVAEVDIGKDIRSDAGKDLLAYLLAAGRFYGGTYDAAEFIALSKRKQPWVREAARYMIGRTWALVAQANGYGTYGEIDHARMDRTALDKAESALKAYVKAYPRGQYTASAYGLLRRVYWLVGDNDALMHAYGWQIAQMDPALRNASEVDLAQEIDAKLPLEAYTAKDSDPILLAVDDLRRMRPSENAMITAEALAVQRPRFAGQQALFDYLLAAHAYYVDKVPQRVLQLIPAVPTDKRTGYLDFSRAALRALALDAARDAGARDALAALIARAAMPYQRQTAEIALAMHDERNAALQRVFAADSLIADPLLRQRLLRNVAGPELLRSRAKDTRAGAHERDIALFTLLYKQLTRGKYVAFIADAKLMPPSAAAEFDRYYKLGDVPAFDDFRWTGTKAGYLCPTLGDIAAALAKSPQASRPGLCLAEFVRINGYDHFELDTQPPTDELGGTTSLFPGKAYSRQTVYQRIIADASAPAEDKAYALFRAVNCYAPSGYNDCGAEGVPLAARKAWFNQLKSNYAETAWAKKLEYYW
jgi:hypothetical protein